VDGHGDVYRWEDREAVYAKFESLARTVLNASQIKAVKETVMDLENCGDLAKLAKLLAPVAERQKATA
jgi:hypothetical protein